MSQKISELIIDDINNEDDQELDSVCSEEDEDEFCEHEKDSSYNMDPKLKYDKCQPYHYGKCIYCILNGIPYEEEWDSWTEVTSRAMEIILMGYRDEINGFMFVPTDNYEQQKTNYYQKQLNAIRLYYNTGRQFAQGTFDKNTSILFDKNII